MIYEPSIQAALRDKANNSVWDLVGSGAPTDGTSGTGVTFAGPGSSYRDIVTGLIYFNINTVASPTWSSGGVAGAALANGKLLVGNGGGIAVAVTPTGDVTISNAGVTAIEAAKVLSAMLDPRLVHLVTGQISAADIVATSAGKFGHASGYPVVSAPGANIALVPLMAIISYIFATAAYTDGGNTTLNWGSGGAALTGLVSAANFAGAGSSKPIVLYPLATAGVPLVSNAELNLVSSAAFTNPGTAAGVINYKILFTTQVLNTAA